MKKKKGEKQTSLEVSREHAKMLGSKKSAQIEAVMKRYEGMRFHIMKILHCSYAESEDTYMEVWEKIILNIKNYSNDFALSTWMYKIASNHCIDMIRKKGLPMHEGEDTDDMIEKIKDKNYADRPLQKAEKHIALIEAVDSLPRKYHDLVYARFFDELEYTEIAEKLDIPLGTVKAQLFRAKGMLYERLKKHELFKNRTKGYVHKFTKRKRKKNKKQNATEVA